MVKSDDRNGGKKLSPSALYTGLLKFGRRYILKILVEAARQVNSVGRPKLSEIGMRIRIIRTCSPPIALRRNRSTFPASSSLSSGYSRRRTSLESSKREPEDHLPFLNASPLSTSSRSPLSSSVRRTAL